MSGHAYQTVDREQRLDEVVAAYLEAADSGQPPDRAAWLARYPDLARELSKFFADQDQVERWTFPSAPANAGQLGEYRIVREIGRGGMGIVYEAQQSSLRRRVALKVLPFAATLDARRLQRFHNEARAAAGLHHAHIVNV